MVLAKVLNWPIFSRRLLFTGSFSCRVFSAIFVAWSAVRSTDFAISL